MFPLPLPLFGPLVPLFGLLPASLFAVLVPPARFLIFFRTRFGITVSSIFLFLVQWKGLHIALYNFK